ncbi:hypothetical protein PIB30_004035 [Stylosanthes scabra]|uniref:Uncharacterized protein n=1 Tax=Stylosanthes scabra TaxID=79078 RepID=A0ABU6Y0U1_9FABA|nr:hypothetical protein [Stylosanthes scabra]
MKPFTYPPFPNAPFGFADSFPDPPKGSLSSDYIPNYFKTRHVTICSYKWCQQRDYFVQGRTTIERHPPDAKPTKIIGTASEPTHQKKDMTSEGESQDKPKKEKKPKKSSSRSKKRAASDIEGEVPASGTSSKKRTSSDTGAEIPHPKAKKLKAKTAKRERTLVGNEEEKTQKKEHSASSPQSDTIGAEGIETTKAAEGIETTKTAEGIETTKAADTDISKAAEAERSLLASSCQFFQVYEPLGGASGNPGSASTTAAMSSSVAHLDFVISFPQTDQEGSYIVPTPESGDLNINEDDFDLTSILSEAKEAYSLEFRTNPVKTEKTSDDTQGAESSREEASFQFDQQQGGNQTMQDSTRDEVDSSLIITDHAAKIHECLNRSLSDLITDETLKATLVEASAILGQHGVAQAETLQRFLEDLYECDKMEERSREE